MNALAHLDPGVGGFGFAATVGLIIAVAAGLSEALARLAGRSGAATRHDAWLLGLVAIGASPLIALGVERSGLVLATWPAREASPSPEAIAAPPEPPAPRWDPPPPVAADPGPVEVAAFATSVEAPATPAPLPSPAVAPALPLRPKPAPADPRSIAAGGLVAAWLVGVGLMAARLVAGGMALRALRRRLVPIEPGVDGVLAEVAGALAPAPLPPIFEASGLAGPVACGVIRPIVVLPLGMAARLDRSGLRDVLIHEAAHVIRRDPLVGLMQRLASAAFWPHPLVHRLNRRLTRAREESCDDRAIRAGDPVGYARTLLRLAEAGGGRVGLAPGLFDSRWRLEDRVSRILEPPKGPIMIRSSGRFRFLVAAALASASVAIAAVRPGGEMEGPKLAAPAEAPAGVGEPSPVEGQVVDEAGAPVAGASVNGVWLGKAPEDARTGPDGRFSLRMGGPVLPAGLIRADDAGGSRIGVTRIDPPVRSHPGPLRIVVKPARAVVVRVRDGSGVAVAGASVEVATADGGPLDRAETGPDGVARFLLPADARVETVAALKDGVGFDYFENYRGWPSSRRDPLPAEVSLVLGGVSPAGVRAVDSGGRPLAGVKCYPWLIRKRGKLADYNGSGSEIARAMTGEDGVARFPWLPNDRTDPSMVMFDGLDYHAPDRAIMATVPRPDPTVRVLRNVRVAGRVTNPDGSPAPGVLVQAEGRGKATDYGRRLARTAADGSYSMNMPPDQMCLIAVVDAGHAAAPLGGIVLREGQPRDGLDLKLVPGTRFRARLTTGPEGKPVADGQLTILVRGVELPEEFRGPNSADDRQDLVTWVKADAGGWAECRLGPGDYTILGHENLTVNGTGEVVRTYVQTPREVWDPQPLVGRVVDAATDRPIVGALVRFRPLKVGGRDIDAEADAAGHFTIETVAEEGEFWARNPSGGLAGFGPWTKGPAGLKNEGVPVAGVVVIALEPAASATGRVVDDAGRGMAGRSVHLSLGTDPDRPGSFYEHATTDAAGRYAFGGLVPAFRCEVSTSHEERRDGSGLVEHHKFDVRGSDPIAIADLIIPAKGAELPPAPKVAPFRATDVVGANPMPYVITRADVEGLILAIGREPATPELVDRIGVIVRPQANWVTELTRISRLATDPGFRARADGASAAVLGRPADTATLVELARLYRVASDDATMRRNLRDLQPKGPVRSIRGVVEDASTGRPVVGAFVFGASTSTRTDDQGGFVLGHRGARQVWVEAEGYALAEIPDPPDPSKPASARLVREEPILGVVAERDGKPVEGAVIWAMVNHSMFRPGAVRAKGDSYGFPLTARSDRSGRFAFRGMPPGAKLDWVELFDPRFLTSGRGRPVLTADRITPVVVEPGCTVAGEVVDEAGRPAVGASVQAREGGSRQGRYSAFTDAEGRYRFGNVRAGRWDLLVEPEAGAPRVVAVVADPARPAIQQVVVEAGGSVGGTVVDAAGQPVANEWVGWIELVDGSGRPQESSYLGRFTPTDADGRFRIDHLPAGAVRVTATDSAGGKAEATLRVGRSDHVLRLGP